MTIDIWDQLPNAPTFESGTPLNPGHYNVLIEKVFTKPTQKIGPVFIAEFQILTSTQRVEPEYAAVMPNVQGTSASWLVKLSNQNTALPNIKQFTCGIFGVDHKEDQFFNSNLPLIVRRVTSAENLFAGIRVHVDCTYTLIQSGAHKGKNFTRHDWSPVQDLGDGFTNPTIATLLARPVPQFAAPPPQAPWGQPPTPPGWGAPQGMPPGVSPGLPQQAWGAPAQPYPPPGPNPFGALPPGYPPPPPAPPVNPTANWQRANGHRLNPATNQWELDR